MSACPKLQFEDDDLSAEYERSVEPGPPPCPSWWQRAIHLAALLGLLGLCALLGVVGLLCFSLAIEPG
jgi:hypothetical protein